ncbi:hypothetical protein M422DRAFT_216812 [Sphaerobolus stellatus SS14]|uniref:Golgi pH regulator n=1 Tax=Sphaerobolus stellatus (strain SS14) TaxID=990650 RepID=A0A0C9UJG0_SPHS4|nr:hypothetical protein M422DRAFT_216812 [Sphaerobolus stellatus SS14]
MATSSQLLIETGIISLGRTALFLLSSQYLRRSLYQDLRHLSSSSAPLSAGYSRNTDNYNELDELPAPATTPLTPSSANPFSKSAGGGNPNNRSWHSTIATWTFSLCFSESCTLFLLVLSQALGLFSERGRYLNWQISLGFLLSSILLIAPLQQCFLLTSKTSKGSGRRRLLSHLILTGLPYSVYLFVISHVPLPANMQHPEFSTSTLARLVVVGTIILGLLAGFGAVSAFFTYFQFSRARRETISEARILTSEQALSRVRNDLAQRQRQLDRTAVNASESQGGFFSRMNPFSSESESSAIQREIQGLEALEYHMSRNLEYMQQRRAESLFAQTLQGKIFLWIGKIFALYCAFRVINSIINIVHPLTSSKSVSTPDLVAGLLTRVFSAFYPVSEEDIAAASRQFSLLLVGAIILSSVRRALRGVTGALKVTSRNTAASFLLLILAQLMGIYLLSTLIQMRTSFPSSNTNIEQINLFETLPQYHVFGPLWDGAFLASVAVTGFVRWFDEKVNGPGLD